MKLMNNYIFTICLVLTSKLVLASPFTIDQRADTEIYPNAFLTSSAIGQTFSPTSNSLDHIELQLTNWSATNTASVYIEIFDEVNGTILGTSNTISFNKNISYLAHFEFTSINISGYNSLLFVVTPTSGVEFGVSLAFSDSPLPNDIYSGGGIEFFDPISTPNDDFWFRTGYVAVPAPVPVPAAVWLLGSGLITIIGLSRRKVKHPKL